MVESGNDLVENVKVHVQYFRYNKKIHSFG